MSSHLTDLLTLIMSVYDRHKIPTRKAMRVTLVAAAKRKFPLWKSDGSRLKLNDNERDWLLYLAAKAEQQTEVRWWTKAPWSALRSVLVNESKFWNWADHAFHADDNAVVVAAPRLRTVVVQLLKDGNQPASTIPWKAFCDVVRDRCRGWKDQKERIAKRGFSDKSIERIVKKLTPAIEAGRLDKSDNQDI
jgi:hypothetical protein